MENAKVCVHLLLVARLVASILQPLLSMPPKRLFIDSDDENSHSYPEALFESVKDQEWTSPAKKQKSIKASRKAGPHHKVPRREQSTASQSSRRESIPERCEEEEEEEGQTRFHDLPDLTPTVLPIPEVSDLALDAFVDAVHSYSVGFYHLESNIFVVQGYDTTRGAAQVRFFYYFR